MGETGSGWDLDGVEPPWGAGLAIHDHIRTHMVPGQTGLAAGGARLPDERDDGRMKWVGGALDGVFGHHFGGRSDPQGRAAMLHRALAVVLEDPSAAKVEALYGQLCAASVLAIVDTLLERIVEQQDLDPARLTTLAVWLARNAPDRGPVKFAIALLGILPGADQRALLLTLGRHEEFSLYAAVALSRTAGDDAEGLLFELARQVEGWGRIQIVERLAGTRDPAIKGWMLREGYKNAVMYEYLACTCAVAGGLRAALEQDRVDRALLDGAADIIGALVTGGPAEDMDDYADGAVVAERFLHHFGAAPTVLRHLVGAEYIGRFLDEPEADWADRATRGWTPALRARLTERISAIAALPHWPGIVLEGLGSDDSRVFSDARRAVRMIGLEPWEEQFALLAYGRADVWDVVMQSDDPARIDRVLALAEEALPLDALATGPADARELGTTWATHERLGFVLQELRRFPGRGWVFIRSGVRSPVVANRHMALEALSTWGMARWPDGAAALLEATLADEPRDDLRTSISRLLAGEALDDRDR